MFKKIFFKLTFSIIPVICLLHIFLILLSFEQILQLHALITLGVYICFVRWHPRLRQATARVEPAPTAHGATYFNRYKQMWGTVPPPAAVAPTAGRGGG
jgi:hypothetical protein